MSHEVSPILRVAKRLLVNRRAHQDQIRLSDIGLLRPVPPSIVLYAAFYLGIGVCVSVWTAADLDAGQSASPGTR